MSTSRDVKKCVSNARGRFIDYVDGSSSDMALYLSILYVYRDISILLLFRNTVASRESYGLA